MHTQYLELSGNKIGNAGMTALATAVGNGALPALENLFISSPSAELQAICASKSIKLKVIGF